MVPRVIDVLASSLPFAYFIARDPGSRSKKSLYPKAGVGLPLCPSLSRGSAQSDQHGEGGMALGAFRCVLPEPIHHPRGEGRFGLL
jgi:hypothetical protein